MLKTRIAFVLVLLQAIAACTLVYPTAFFGKDFEVYESDSHAWNIDLGDIPVGSFKTIHAVVECKSGTSDFQAKYFLEVQGPKDLSNDFLKIAWQDTDGASFTIGKDGDQPFSGTEKLTWNSPSVIFAAGHKNNVTLTLTFVTMAAVGAYKAKMWVAFSPIIRATVAISPNVLNPSSEGEPIIALVSLPEQYKTDDADIDSILLCLGDRSVRPEHGIAADHLLLLIFSRKEVIEMVCDRRGWVELTLSGEIGSLQLCGSDSIFVLAS